MPEDNTALVKVLSNIDMTLNESNRQSVLIVDMLDNLAVSVQKNSNLTEIFLRNKVGLDDDKAMKRKLEQMRIDKL